MVISIRDTFCAVPGKIENGDTGEIACDHFHLRERDLELIQSLGAGAYRFSLS